MNKRKQKTSSFANTLFAYSIICVLFVLVNYLLIYSYQATTGDPYFDFFKWREEPVYTEEQIDKLAEEIVKNDWAKSSRVPKIVRDLPPTLKSKLKPSKTDQKKKDDKVIRDEYKWVYLEQNSGYGMLNLINERIKALLSNNYQVYDSHDKIPEENIERNVETSRATMSGRRLVTLKWRYKDGIGFMYHVKFFKRDEIKVFYRYRYSSRGVGGSRWISYKWINNQWEATGMMGYETKSINRHISNNVFLYTEYN